MTMFYVLDSACKQIPCPVFDIAYIIKQLIQIVVPVILIIMGMLDFGKATMAQDENGIAQAKKMFIKRLISACCVFFVMAILQLTFNILAASAKDVENGQSGESVWSCVNAIFNGRNKDDNSMCNDNEFGDQPVTNDDAKKEQ